jgi:hypothetical protein
MRTRGRSSGPEIDMRAALVMVPGRSLANRILDGTPPLGARRNLPSR